MFFELRTWTVLTAVICLSISLGRAKADTFSVAIAASLDDVEENLDDPGASDLGESPTSSDLELGTEGPPDGRQSVGMRFLDIGIPAGSTISSAGIQFMVDEDDDEITNVRITGELSPNSAPFELTPLNVSSRTRTLSSVVWNNIPIWSGEGTSGPDQLTPDLSTIVQEIIDQPGWAMGNALSIIIEPDPIDYADGERTAISFDKADGNPNFNPPILNIEFNPIPEPSGLALLGLGGLLVGLVRGRGR